MVVENPQSSNKTTNNYLKGRRETRVGVGKRGKGVMDVQKEACTQGTAVWIREWKEKTWMYPSRSSWFWTVLKWKGYGCVEGGSLCENWILNRLEGEKIEIISFFLFKEEGRFKDSSSQGSESVRFAQNRMFGGSAKRGEDASWSREKETENASYSYVREALGSLRYTSSVSRSRLTCFAVSHCMHFSLLHL